MESVESWGQMETRNGKRARCVLSLKTRMNCTVLGSAGVRGEMLPLSRPGTGPTPLCVAVDMVGGNTSLGVTKRRLMCIVCVVVFVRPGRPPASAPKGCRRGLGDLGSWRRAQLIDWPTATLPTLNPEVLNV
jgi:hypothetical protein